jgi:4-aminobutyrate aminotransferase and related aminotransferases
MTAPASIHARRIAPEALAARPISIVTEPPGPRGREMIARALPHLSPSLIHCYPLMVRRASGCMVEDVDDNVYLDAEAGVATASTGHCHPAVADAIAAQAEVLIHICGTDFHYPGYGAMCERLGALVQRIGPNSITGRRSSPTRAPRRSRARSSSRATPPGVSTWSR